MTIWDTFMVGNNYEADLLEARLVELEEVRGVVHVAIECDVDHQGHAKPYWLSDNLDRFAPWKDRLRVVRATGLPTVAENSDAWSREQGQRDFAIQGMTDAGLDDIVLHGDLDEIPTPLAVRNVRPRGFVAFDMRLVSMAVDWLHPHRWRGTVAARVGDLHGPRPFNTMRDARNTAKALPDAGTHMSWLGGAEAARRKMESFCHREIEAQVDYGLRDGTNHFLEAGLHVDGVKMLPVDVDETWPRYVYERRCPESWWRPR